MGKKIFSVWAEGQRMGRVSAIGAVQISAKLTAPRIPIKGGFGWGLL